MKALSSGIVFIFCLAVACAALGDELADTPPVIIDYFYEPGCPDCLRVREQIIPLMDERFEGFYELNKYDMGLKSNVIVLAAYQEQLRIVKNESVCIIVDYRLVFNGFTSIKEGLFDGIDECVEARLGPDWTPPEPIVVEGVGGGGVGVVSGRVDAFTLPAVLIAGLIDGINPCAIATLVFFMSVLSVSKVRGRGLLLMGIAFCVASFVTYTAIGFGLLRFLHLFTGFPNLRSAAEVIMILVLAIFSYLSFRDACRYKASGSPGDVTLQLPGAIKSRIHRVMRTGVRSKNLVTGGLIIGALVTALESVCTGQVYVPTLVLVITSHPGPNLVGKAWSYLLLYNAMFIMPLVVVFMLTYFGLKTDTLIQWSKKNVVISKILLGCFFLAMALLIGWIAS